MSDIAKDALVQVIKSASSGDQAILNSLKQFADAIREVDPQAHFSAQEICQWARIVQEHMTEGEPMPQRMLSPHSLGRFLSDNHQAAGLINVGSYGNRQIYAVGEQNED